jgi:hypothetical protein
MLHKRENASDRWGLTGFQSRGWSQTDCHGTVHCHLRRDSALELRSIDAAEMWHGMLYLWKLVGAARSPVSARRHQDRHALICAAAVAVEVGCRLVDLHQMHAGPDRYSFLARLGKRDR